jgi:FkbH-like protein
MFEFDQAAADSTNLATPELPYEPVSDIDEMSLLVWGEHCIECAAPACFTTCDLYESRPDTRCRRFRLGARRNPNFRSFRGYGVEIEFKQWAKVESRGNTRLAPARVVRRMETMLEMAAPAVNLVGKTLAAVTGDIRPRWSNQVLRERLGRAVHRRQRSSAKPSLFLLEVYNLESTALNLIMTVAPAASTAKSNGQISSTFRTTLVLPPGYSRHEVDYRLFSKITDLDSFDISLTPEADAGGRLVFLTADFVRLTSEAKSKDQKNIKCVVWDLDNTLWPGVLLEGAPPMIRPEVLKLIRFLDDRGILLSIASKNDSESALAALRTAGVADYFLYPQINWNPKSHSIKQIAEALNIGLDTFAFIDDNPFEREEVAAVLPQVLCLDSADVAPLAADGRFQGSTSSEARARRRMYKEAIQREEEQEQYSGDYLAFLRTCGIQLEIGGYTPDDFDRAAELVQRTNQLNFSGRKYTRGQLFEIVEDSTVDKYVLRCSDKYGSYGTIGLALVRSKPGELFIEDLMVSCRVQGKFLEQAFFAHILTHHNPGGATTIRVNYQQTPKNTPARKVLETIGFTAGEDNSMVLHDGAALSCDFITLVTACC